MVKLYLSLLLTIAFTGSAAFAKAELARMEIHAVGADGETFTVGDLLYKWRKPDNKDFWSLSVSRAGRVLYTINLGQLMREKYDLCTYGIFDNPDHPLFVCSNIVSDISGKFAFYDVSRGGFDVVELSGKPSWPMGPYKSRIVVDVITDSWHRPHKEVTYILDLNAAAVVSAREHAKDDFLGRIFGIKGEQGFFRTRWVNGENSIERLDENLNLLQKKSMGDWIMNRMDWKEDAGDLTYFKYIKKTGEMVASGNFDYARFDFNWFLEGQVKVQTLTAAGGQTYGVTAARSTFSSSAFGCGYEANLAKIGANFGDQKWLTPLTACLGDLGLGSGSEHYKDAVKFSALTLNSDQSELSFSIEYRMDNEFCHADFRLDNQSGKILERKVIGPKPCQTP